MLSEDEKRKIVEALGQKVPQLKCPMCTHNKFSLAEGYFNNFIQDLKNISLGGPSIPTAAIICENCGFVSQHALGALKLLPKEETKKQENGN